MKSLNINYKDLKPDQSCLKILPLEFVNKYNCIIYCSYDNGKVVLVNENFDYYNLNKLSFFIKEELFICYVHYEDWNELTKNLKINDDRNQAINKFQINSNIISQSSLNENNKVFYNAEIESSPIVKIVDSIIEEAINYKSSDIHFEPYESFVKVRLRIDGKLFDKSPLPFETFSELSTRIKVLANLDITKKFILKDSVKFL